MERDTELLFRVVYLDAKEYDMFDLAATKTSHQFLDLRDDHAELGLVDESSRVTHLKVRHGPAQALWILSSATHAQVDV